MGEIHGELQNVAKWQHCQEVGHVKGDIVLIWHRDGVRHGVGGLEHGYGEAAGEAVAQGAHRVQNEEQVPAKVPDQPADPCMHQAQYIDHVVAVAGALARRETHQNR